MRIQTARPYILGVSRGIFLSILWTRFIETRISRAIDRTLIVAPPESVRNPRNLIGSLPVRASFRYGGSPSSPPSVKEVPGRRKYFRDDPALPHTICRPTVSVITTVFDNRSLMRKQKRAGSTDPAQRVESRHYSGLTDIYCVSLNDTANSFFANRNMSSAFLFRSFSRRSFSFPIGIFLFVKVSIR